MGSPLLTSAWWFPELRKGREPADNFFDAIGLWAPTQRLRDPAGVTHNNLLELLRLVQLYEIRLVQGVPGSVEELPADPVVCQHILDNDGEGIFFGTSRLTADGLFDAQYLLTAHYAAEKIIQWNVCDASLTLPPVINERPQKALGELRRLEEESLRRLMTNPGLIKHDKAAEEALRNALIDLDEALLISDVVAYPSTIDAYYLQLLNAADHVSAIVDIVSVHAPHATSALLPLRRAAQQARGNAWCEWMYREP